MSDTTSEPTRRGRTPRGRRGASAPPAAAPAAAAAELPERLARRVIIEHVRPEIDGGRFPVKRTPGERVVVAAAIHADGHDALAASLWYRTVEHHGAGSAASPSGPFDAAAGWQEVTMVPLGNDEWTATFTIGDGPGAAEYTIEAWVDSFATWRRGLAAKVQAGQDVSSELLEGAALLLDAASRSPRADVLLERAAFLASDADMRVRETAALDPIVADAASAATDRRRATVYDRVLRVLVDRERARFASWYEMFPRSGGTDPGRSASFREAESALPRIAAMAFDVLYLPPVHPIGHTHRKGRNNTLTPAPGDVGSPWAIGSEAGGHTAVDPGLGTLEDFEHFFAAARGLGLEVALDLAYQCSPDHPWVREHPEWFRHRPDGTIKYAENPPKKYQDIYPIDFECAEWRSLWVALKGVVEFWCARGVRIFRVDNPHTKAFHFWEWMIADVRQQYPDVIFLAEAFTRPRIMKYLAKLGFDQSYTYFTWRNTRTELMEYFTELTQTDVREYMRPNLFANTPDILHEYLQAGGPGAFRIRLMLAATLGATYGIYSGFELCENVPVRPGSEEYLDSEKYQVRVRDWDAPGNLAPLITRVNTIRRQHPALQSDWSLRFFATDNPEILCYAKSTGDNSDLLLVVVSLDPHHMQQGWVQAPIADVRTGPDGGYAAEDLLTGARYLWRGEWNYVRLTPEHPAHILHLPSAASSLGA
ncbi:MAG TPA: alpha-1,4-glucan--maltose-1-phosphate maltosyltransferase [Vicinamibacterales bacterium]|nr:alpha-1,4-glucan--maltose-1-phosphate maltosyltransferase [Vicinamibacterales bacterium]